MPEFQDTHSNSFGNMVKASTLGIALGLYNNGSENGIPDETKQEKNHKMGISSPSTCKFYFNGFIKHNNNPIKKIKNKT